MKPTTRTKITVQNKVNAPLEKVWTAWTEPRHITQWNFATDEWHCPKAVNQLEAGGKFNWRMEAKDGSMGFDYAGEYQTIEKLRSISGKLDDGRQIIIHFEKNGDEVLVTETFEIEDQHTADMQRQGWQSILDNFKKHAESI